MRQSITIAGGSRLPLRKVDNEPGRYAMKRRLIAIFALFATVVTTRFQCDWKNPFASLMAEPPAGVQIPFHDKMLRAADTVLMEPGYANARALVKTWERYMAGFASDDRRAKELEILANEPAILGFVNDPEGRLAPVFREEARRLLDTYGNGSLKAWRLRSVAGKVVLGHNEKLLKNAEDAVTRREISPRGFTIPMRGSGFNFSLDAEWDITRLPDFPLSQVNSEYLFFQTDHELNLAALPDGNNLPDSAYRFVSGNKFISEPYGVHNGMRIVAVRSADHFLIICYPFAGYIFYAVRGSLVLLLIAALIYGLTRLAALRSAAHHVLENRSGKWLEDHYSQSLSLSEKAIGLTDKSIGVVEQIKEREAQVISELGRHLQGLSKSITDQTRQILEEASAPARASAESVLRSQTEPAIIRPLHKKSVRKEPILISPETKPDIAVSIELDLPLRDEKQLPPEEKAQFLSSLRRKARDKSAPPEYIHDERIDNYDYVAPEPMPIPKPDVAEILKSEPDTANLDYVQKFRYAGKARVLPMAAVSQKGNVLRVREDLHREELTLSEEE